MYVYIYVNTHIISVYVYGYMQTLICTNRSLCTHVYMYPNMHIYINACIHINIYLCIKIGMTRIRVPKVKKRSKESTVTQESGRILDSANIDTSSSTYIDSSPATCIHIHTSLDTSTGIDRSMQDSRIHHPSVSDVLEGNRAEEEEGGGEASSSAFNRAEEEAGSSMRLDPNESSGTAQHEEYTGVCVVRSMDVLRGEETAP